jgi:hypothetical protein
MSKKQWPGDAVIIVAPPTGTEVVDPDEPTALHTCRDCGASVTVRNSSIRVSEQAGHTCGRPIKFFCISCAVTYDVNSMDRLIDLRRSPII